MHLYPHVINRQLCGAKLLSQWHVRVDCDLFLRDILKLDLTDNDAEEIVNSILLTLFLLPFLDPEKCTATFVPLLMTGGQSGPREKCLPAAYRLQLFTEDKS